jgi:hypothetical protein
MLDKITLNTVLNSEYTRHGVKALCATAILVGGVALMALLAASFVTLPPTAITVPVVVLGLGCLFFGCVGLYFAAKKACRAFEELFEACETVPFPAPQAGEVYSTSRVPYLHECTSFTDKLEEGDLVFFKLDPKKFGVRSLFSHDDQVDYAILMGQWFSKFWSRSKDIDSESFIHVGMVVKNSEGKLSLVEATTGDHGDDVRIVLFEEAALSPESKQEYLVVRPKDKEEAALAVKMAKMIATEVIYDADGKPNTQTKARYDKKEATGSLLRNSKWGRRAKEDLLFFYAMRQRGDDAVLHLDDKKSLRTFFCSYFIGACLQQAALEKNLESILPRIEINELNMLIGNNRSVKELRKWAKRVSKEQSKALDTLIPYRFDPRNTTPQRLQRHVQRHPERYEAAVRITKPLT